MDFRKRLNLCETKLVEKDKALAHISINLRKTKTKLTQKVGEVDCLKKKAEKMKLKLRKEKK